MLHLVDSIWHRTYLSYWGVDAKLFPQSTDQIMLTGFHALFDRLFLVGVGVTSFALLALVVLVTVMGIPALAAEMSAKKTAQANAADFAKGYARSMRDCIEIVCREQVPLRGYLLKALRPILPSWRQTVAGAEPCLAMASKSSGQ